MDSLMLPRKSPVFPIFAQDWRFSPINLLLSLFNRSVVLSNSYIIPSPNIPSYASLSGIRFDSSLGCLTRLPHMHTVIVILLAWIAVTGLMWPPSLSVVPPGPKPHLQVWCWVLWQLHDCRVEKLIPKYRIQEVKWSVCPREVRSKESEGGITTKQGLGWVYRACSSELSQVETSGQGF